MTYKYTTVRLQRKEALLGYIVPKGALFIRGNGLQFICIERPRDIWYGIHNIECNLSWSEYRETRLDYFECELEIVDYLDIPDWDNYESVYVPMFSDAEILIR